MTQDQQRQKADLLLEHLEAEAKLTGLREKAGRFSETIGKVAKWLGNEGTELTISTDEFKIFDPAIDAEIRADIAHYAEALDFKTLLALMEEIQEAKSRCKQLAERKAALGLTK